MLTEDYIIRMIRDMGRLLARVLGSDLPDPDAPVEWFLEHSSGHLPLLEEVKARCDQGKINEA